MENNTIQGETISQKSDLQNMIDEENYNSSVPELVQMRKDARILMKKYNDSGLDSEEERLVILTKLFGKHEGGIKIEPPFFCDYGFNIKVGKNFYMNFDCVILDCASVEIGDNVLCGPKVQLYTPSHPLEAEPRSNGVEFAKKIKIGNNVWIGGGAIVCPGVTIGDNTVIGAGSVVTKNIPSDVVAVGNPCKVIKNLK
jgi:maltose O-acetyltransferase